jgi:hypothetical protein
MTIGRTNKRDREGIKEKGGKEIKIGRGKLKERNQRGKCSSLTDHNRKKILSAIMTILGAMATWRLGFVQPCLDTDSVVKHKEFINVRSVTSAHFYS